jgi:hypothetical protein
MIKLFSLISYPINSGSKLESTMHLIKHLVNPDSLTQINSSAHTIA